MVFKACYISCLMERKLVELSTDIFVYGKYMLADENGERTVRVSAFDVSEGWFEAEDGAGKERYFMKDYGIKPIIREATWEPESNGKRMFLVRE